jgi:hypothetical protein
MYSFQILSAYKSKKIVALDVKKSPHGMVKTPWLDFTRRRLVAHWGRVPRCLSLDLGVRVSRWLRPKSSRAPDSPRPRRTWHGISSSCAAPDRLLLPCCLVGV